MPEKNERIKLTVKGPLFVGGKATRRRVVQTKIRTANEQAFGYVRTMANRTVHTYRKNYERGWGNARHDYGTRYIMRSTWTNAAPNASAMELGVKPGSFPPIQPLVLWLKFRGIAPQSGTDEHDYVGFAAAISKTHYRLGWPNIGSRGYLGPPKPVATGIDRTASQREAAYQDAGRRIAERFGA